MSSVSDKEKHEYLKKWGWTFYEHPDGFKVWKHSRFPGYEYKTGAAYRKMKRIEPDILTPDLTVKTDDPDAEWKLKSHLFKLGILQPSEEDVIEWITRNHK